MEARQFRLVDLLVLIAIVGTAVVVVLASTSTPPGGRRLTCINNARNIGLALLEYDHRHGSFPGYVNPQAIAGSGAAVQSTRPVGWAFEILAFIERPDICDAHGSSGFAGPNGKPFEVPDYFLNILVCPSDPNAKTIRAASSIAPNAALSYVVNCGLKDPTAGLLVPHGSPVPRDQPAHGVFHYNYPFRWATTGAPFPDSYPRGQSPFSFDVPTEEKVTRVSTNFIHAHDGTSNTLILAENVDAGNWTDVLEHQVGFVWVLPKNATTATWDWPRASLRELDYEVGCIGLVLGTETETAFARPSSYHHGVVNVVLADGRAESISCDIDYEIYCRLMAPSDEQAGIPRGRPWPTDSGLGR